MAQVLSGLARRGHRVRAVGPITEEELRGGDRFAAAHAELEVHRYVMPFLDIAPDVLKGPEYYELERARIEELTGALIADRRPDVAIAGRESFAWYVPDLARRHGVPAVVFARGSTTHAMVDGTYPHTDELIDRFNRAELVLTPACHMAESLRRLGVAGVQVVPNPVDVARFRPRPRDAALAAALGIGAGDVVVAHLSNMIPVKRPLDLPHAAVRALAREPRLLFLIVGDGPLRDELEEACVRAGVADRFRLVDWVEYDRIPAYLSLAEILVQPSAAEGQARVYLEAQASGLTVIASDIPAAREVIEDGTTGLLFPRGDLEAFARAIVRAARDPELRGAIGDRALARVQRHALPRIITAHERLLATVSVRPAATPGH